MFRILYMIIFYILYGLTDIALLLIALVQACLSLFSGEPSETLKDAGRSLGIYVKEISEYLSYASERKPFPFSDWPTGEPQQDDLQELK